MKKHRHESELLTRLQTALRERLVSLVAYGPRAHDDEYPGLENQHLLIVVAALDLDTLGRLSDPVRWWLKQGESWPRLFSPQLLRDAADVYPIELLEISLYRQVLHGADPVLDLLVDRENLRRQCERELREKLMRLREGYVERHGRSAHELHELLAVSYPSFVRIFRSCLYLADAPIVRQDREVVTALATWLDLSPAPLLAVDRIAHGERTEDAEAAFASYYRALTAIEAHVDRMIIHPRSTP